jgi:ribosomal protein S6--L-glutamate ligase
MLEGRNGPRILEINSSPGLEGIERAPGVDVAGAIIEHVAGGARQRAVVAKRKSRRVPRRA